VAMRGLSDQDSTCRKASSIRRTQPRCQQLSLRFKLPPPTAHRDELGLLTTGIFGSFWAGEAQREVLIDFQPCDCAPQDPIAVKGRRVSPIKVERRQAACGICCGRPPQDVCLVSWLFTPRALKRQIPGGGGTGVETDPWGRRGRRNSGRRGHRRARPHHLRLQGKSTTARTIPRRKKGTRDGFRPKHRVRQRVWRCKRAHGVRAWLFVGEVFIRSSFVIILMMKTDGDVWAIAGNPPC
jgi:hypothetical protein